MIFIKMETFFRFVEYWQRNQQFSLCNSIPTHPLELSCPFQLTLIPLSTFPSSSDHYFEWNGCNWTNRRAGKYHLFFYPVFFGIFLKFSPVHHIHTCICSLLVSVHAKFTSLNQHCVFSVSFFSFFCNFPFGHHLCYCHAQIEKKSLIWIITLQCIHVP